MPGTLGGLPATSRRKAGMTSSHHAPYALGDTHATMAGTMGSDPARGSESPKAGPSSDRRLPLACVTPQWLETAGQPHGWESVPGACTPRPSPHESRIYPNPLAHPEREGA